MHIVFLRAESASGKCKMQNVNQFFCLRNRDKMGTAVFSWETARLKDLPWVLAFTLEVNVFLYCWCIGGGIITCRLCEKKIINNILALIFWHLCRHFKFYSLKSFGLRRSFNLHSDKAPETAGQYQGKTLYHTLSLFGGESSVNFFFFFAV